MKPLLSRLAHQLFTDRLPSRLLSRFYYTAPLPGDQVALTWLGTAGFAVEYQGRVLLLDPYLSRPGLRASVAGVLRPEGAAVARVTPAADVIVCGHSHHDHIMDVPTIAQRTGATVLGSESSCNLCRSHGLPDARLVQLNAPQTEQLGPFRITVRPSIHARGPLNRIPLVGRIPSGTRAPMPIRGYRSDTTFGVLVEIGLDVDGREPLRLFHLSSADFLPETLSGLRCDVLLPAIVSRQRRDDFTGELLRALQPRVVIPHHFDDFFAPLGEPVRQLPGADVEGFLDEVHRSRVETSVLVLRKLGKVRFGLDGQVVESDPGR